MAFGVEGDAGGILGLRRLIGGEYAGALNCDLRKSGFPGVDWAGTIHLSWWELKQFVEHECRDESSAVFRQINPDAESMDTILMRHMAQAVADMRALTAASMYEEPPSEFGFVEFRWPGAPEAEQVDHEAELARKREIAARARARAVGAA